MMPREFLGMSLEAVQQWMDTHHYDYEMVEDDLTTDWPDSAGLALTFSEGICVEWCYMAWF